MNDFCNDRFLGLNIPDAYLARMYAYNLDMFASMCTITYKAYVAQILYYDSATLNQPTQYTVCPTFITINAS
jgi:hypothetical protein